MRLCVSSRYIMWRGQYIYLLVQREPWTRQTKTKKTRMKGYFNAREGDSRGGIGSNHQGNESRPQVSKHVGQLWRKQKKTNSLLTSSGKELHQNDEILSLRLREKSIIHFLKHRTQTGVVLLKFQWKKQRQRLWPQCLSFQSTVNALNIQLKHYVKGTRVLENVFH